MLRFQMILVVEETEVAEGDVVMTENEVREEGKVKKNLNDVLVIAISNLESQVQEAAHHDQDVQEDVKLCC